MKKIAALFDFDGTLARGDSAAPFALFVLRHRPGGILHLPWLSLLLAGYAAGRVSKKHMKTAMLSLLANSDRERIERLALIDGVIPYTGEADEAPQKLGAAIEALLAVDDKRKPVYATFDQAVAARMKGVGAVSHEAAQLLAQRGLMPVPGGYTWRTDARLMLPSAMRLTRAHALAFVERVACPASLVLAEGGLMTQPELRSLVKRLPFAARELPGGHHLHLDDEAGAEAVASLFNTFFQA